jgi:hypothetical protein
VARHKIAAALHGLYSIPFLVSDASWATTFSPLKPLNLFYYLATLAVVYYLAANYSTAGRIACLEDRRAVAIVIVSLDATDSRSACDVCLLSLLLVLALLLIRRLAFPATVALGIAGAALVTVFWVDARKHVERRGRRGCASVVFLVFRMIRERSSWWVTRSCCGDRPGDVVRSVAARKHDTRRIPSACPHRSPFLQLPTAATRRRLGAGRSTRSEIGVRISFLPRADQNIGSDVQFTSVSDIVRFVPRAAVIGFLAPFPRMWFEAGSYGIGGRLISGAETLVMYFCTRRGLCVCGGSDDGYRCG